MRIGLQDLSKSYGKVRAVSGVSLTFEPGRVYGLLGENGAGKSTLMRLLAGFTRPDSGVVWLDGVAANFSGPGQAQAAGIGMLHQDPLDFPGLEVWENFELGGPGLGRLKAKAKLEALGRKFDFSLNPQRRVAQLGVGERLQLELLRFMNLGVRALILDEPSTGLSLPQKENLFRVLRSLCQEREQVAVVVTHKLSEAMEHCDELYLMREGRLVGHQKPPYQPEEILRQIFGRTAASVKPGTINPVAQGPKLCKLAKVAFEGRDYTLEDLNLEINSGEVIGLCGLEGNGQELFLSGLAGLAGLGQGTFEFKGRRLEGLDAAALRKLGIAYLPAARLERALFPGLSLLDHLCLVLGGPRDAQAGRFAVRCQQGFKVKAGPRDWPGELSGGNQQRFLLSLLDDKTSLALIEHPTRGLDIESAELIWSKLKDLAKQGASVVFSSSDLDEILAQATRILVFAQRRLAADLPNSGLDNMSLGRLMLGQDAQ